MHSPFTARPASWLPELFSPDGQATTELDSASLLPVSQAGMGSRALSLHSEPSQQEMRQHRQFGQQTQIHEHLQQLVRTHSQQLKQAFAPAQGEKCNRPPSGYQSPFIKHESGHLDEVLPSHALQRHSVPLGRHMGDEERSSAATRGFGGLDRTSRSFSTPVPAASEVRLMAP